MKLIATFNVKNPFKWDCTKFVQSNPFLLAQVLSVLQEKEYWTDTKDTIRKDPTAPDWVREWNGSFSITVKNTFVNDQIALIQTKVEQLRAQAGDMDDSPA